MKWVKKGLIIEPRVINRDWMISHAMDPTVDCLQGDVFRIYFCGRNKKNQSLIGYADIDINDPFRILKTPAEPVLGLGELGSFDDNGVTASWIVNEGGKKYLYYAGWKPRSTTRFALMAGLAVSTDGGESFRRVSRGPILRLTDKEPFSILTAPCVLKEGALWRMWYVSCVGWLQPDRPRYHIKYTESHNGIDWRQNGTVCIDFKSEDENALARPCVIYEDGRYRMWFSHRSDTRPYRIGYAESNDGIVWTRMDEASGIDVSGSGWDSEMIEYSFVFNHKGKKYMVYNGNGYGVGGVGLAVLDGK